MQQVGRGFYWQDYEVGARYVTFGRTVTEPDIVSFIGCTGMVEVLFTDAEFRRSQSLIEGRLAPAALTYAFAEGLVLQAVAQGTGLAFLGARLEVAKPVIAGDTITVEIEVLEVRQTSKGTHGLVKTRNEVKNQRGELVLAYDPLRMIKGRPA